MTRADALALAKLMGVSVDTIYCNTYGWRYKINGNGFIADIECPDTRSKGGVLRRVGYAKAEVALEHGKSRLVYEITNKKESP